MYCLCIFDIIGATGNFVKCAGKKRVFLIGTVLQLLIKGILTTQLSPEILTQGENRKKHPNFLEANFENF